MNRHPTTIRARALAALLLLAVLWPLGMGSSRANDAGQQPSAAHPASGTTPTDESPASAPPTASAPLPASAPPTATEMPVSLQGKWWAYSKVFDMARPLTLGARTLRWYICGKAARRIKPLVTNNGQQTAYPAFMPSYAPPITDDEQLVLIDLTANGTPPCKLYGQWVTQLRLRHGSVSTGPDDFCMMQVTLYGHAPHSTKTELLDWGVFVTDKWSAKTNTCPQSQLKSN